MFLWTYWSGKIDLVTRLCLQSWTQHASQFQIMMLTDTVVENLEFLALPANFSDLQPATKSDVIRLKMLYFFGGLWLDASVMLNQNLDWITEQQESFFALHLDQKPYVESWLLYVPQPRNPVIASWMEHLIDILSYEPVTLHPSYQGETCTDRDEYFMVYQAFCNAKKLSHVYSAFERSTKGTANNLFFSVWKFASKSQPVVKFIKNNRSVVQIMYTVLILFIASFVSMCLSRCKYVHSL